MKNLNLKHARNNAAGQKDLSGLSGRIGHHGARAVHPAAMSWITDGLVVETRRVWSKYLGRVVNEDEAVEILVNTRMFVVTIMAAEDDGVPV